MHSCKIALAVIVLVSGMAFSQTFHIVTDSNSIRHHNTQNGVPATEVDTLYIGDLWYDGTTTVPGGTTLEGNYGLNLECVSCINPVAFSNIGIFVKAGKAGTGQAVTTGPTCGTVLGATAPPCEMGWTALPPCGHKDWEGNLVEDCISIAIQLVSTSGKNFIVPLASGQNLCVRGITNVYLTTPAGQLALDPKCDTIGEFCVGVSTPIILRSAQASSCE
jgi:hypothetical protein